MRIITVANQKGGVGKTTTAVTLAHGLALKHHNVLLVDLDPQGQCAPHLGMEQEPGVFDLLVAELPLRDVVRTTGRPNLWLLPGNKRTKTAETLMVIENRGVDTLQTVLGEKVNGSRLHYLILDTAPSVGGIQENALYACDLLLIPTSLDHLGLKGLTEILKTLRAVNRSSPPAMWILPTFYDEVTRESRVNLAHLRETFGDLVLPPIHRATVLRECPALGRTIFEHAPESRAAEEYATLVWEVLNGEG
ncbi:MAG TPA: ParA family protein [Thermoflexia bacterium]|jgi:chromosome partitioning protein|nr:ParA family protein [Thermoflexia bacterium]